jgi:alpha-glucosidase (family GH31 glycosyl hydrolase)
VRGRRRRRVAVEAAPRAGDALVVHLIVADAPYDVTAAFVALTGAIALPPRWAFGPWMSANTWNDQATAMAAVRRTLAEGVPATVLVLEAWSDEATFYVFNDAEYDAVPGGDRLGLADLRFGGRWPDPKGMIDACHAEGVRVVLWQIPVLGRCPTPHPQHDADVAHALERGYVIRHGDGTPYRNAGWWFTDALVFDPTNPDARAWWFDKRRYLFDDLGIDGMKTDGGEHLWGRDLIAWNGQRGTELVNRYAQAYVDAYHGFVTEATGGDGLTFSRAGYVGAQRTPAHWAGDENSTWSAFRASIQAGLSAGMAGVSIWGWDIAGFSGEIPTVELYLRSTQMACFCPVMQYHSELHRRASAATAPPGTSPSGTATRARSRSTAPTRGCGCACSTTSPTRPPRSPPSASRSCACRRWSGPRRTTRCWRTPTATCSAATCWSARCSRRAPRRAPCGCRPASGSTSGRAPPSRATAGWWRPRRSSASRSSCAPTPRASTPGAPPPGASR